MKLIRLIVAQFMASDSPRYRAGKGAKAQKVRRVVKKESISRRKK